MRFFRRNPTENGTAVPQKPNIGLLSRKIAQTFNRDEVRELCFDLSVNFDELPEKGLSVQCAHLIEILQRVGRLPELLALLREKRPRHDWQAPTVPTPQDLQNRNKLLQSVQTYWIESFLHRSLPQTIALELNLSHKPQAVARKTLHIPGQIENPPVDTPLLDVFEKHGRSLLILGDPGSGKTITLLQLAESLIAAAQQDPGQPIPIILNLSSWAQQKQPLLDWLVEELLLQYGMSRKLSRSWIEQNQLLYLLDGLDEVAAEARDACVQAINNFKAEYPAELIVCSRLADYEQLHEKLNVGTAVRLHPLTDDQIQTYLSQPELELTAVRDALATDPNLNDLARSPLFLNIMTLAYRGLTREQLQSFGTLAKRRKHLFDTYVDEMFRRRRFVNSVSSLQKQNTNWLMNLANGLLLHRQSIFYIESLGATWIPKLSHRIIVANLQFTGHAISFMLPFLLIGPILSYFGISISQKVVAFLGLICGLPMGLLFISAISFNRWFRSKAEMLSFINSLKILSLFPQNIVKRTSVALFESPPINLDKPIAVPNERMREISSNKHFRGYTKYNFGTIEHTISRIWMNKIDYLPSNSHFTSFLDDMEKHIFLRRVGNGWIFIHRTLLEYFAALHPDAQPPAGSV